MSLPILKESGVVFNESDHTYFLGDVQLQGITSTLVHRAYPHEYDGVSEEKLAERAAYGHNVHEMLEFCVTNGVDSDMPEWWMFKQMCEDNHLRVLRIEYIVTDFKKYASPIDIVALDENNGIWLIDLKTNYAPPVNKGTVQLSWYKKRFEEMNPDHKVVGCAIAWVRNDAKRGQLSKWIPITPWADEALALLEKCEEDDTEFDMTNLYGDLPAKFAEVETEVARLETQIKFMQERQKTFKEGLYALMEEYNIKSWSGSKVKLTRVLPTESETFDSKSFKADHPELYAQYLKKTKRAGSLKVTVVD